MSRQSSFTQETSDIICQRMADGESLRKICLDDAMPQKRTVLKWLDENEVFRSQYARAREAQADHYAGEIVDISDEDPATVLEAARSEGAPDVLRIDSAVVAHQRLRVDARKWYASKVAPKKYGDRLDTTISAPDGGPISLTVKFGRDEEKP